MKIKITIDVTKITKHRATPGAGRKTYFKDKRKSNRTTEKINFKKGN